MTPRDQGDRAGDDSAEDRWPAPDDAAGQRLDRYLASHYDIARNRVRQWLKAGRVAVNGLPPKASLRLEGGETISCAPLAVTQMDHIEPEEGPLEILFEDADVVVLDKPAGLIVHPGAGRESGTLAQRLLARYPEMGAVGGPGRPGIVHRLDRDTTGALVVARSHSAYRKLSAAFAERTVQKSYLGIAYGAPSSAEGVLDSPIGRHPTRRREMTTRTDGRAATTRFKVLSVAAGICLLDLTLETGRTHQIRVHLKAARWPLVGDPVYGEARWKGLPPPTRRALREFSRPALHAWRLGFDHPETGEPLRFEAPPPSDLIGLWAAVTGNDWPIAP